MAQLLYAKDTVLSARGVVRQGQAAAIEVI